MLLTSSLLYDLASPLGKVVWSRAISLRLVVTAENGSFCKNLKETPPGGLEPPTFRLTAERASQLRHGGFGVYIKFLNFLNFNFFLSELSIAISSFPWRWSEIRQLFAKKNLANSCPSHTASFSMKKVHLANSCLSFEALLWPFGLVSASFSIKKYYWRILAPPIKLY